MLCSSSASSRAQKSKFRNLSAGITPNSRNSRTLLLPNPPFSPSPDQKKRNTNRYRPVSRFALPHCTPASHRKHTDRVSQARCPAALEGLSTCTHPAPWLTAQGTAIQLDTTRSGVYRLPSLGL